MTERTRLPNRRPQLTEGFSVGQTDYHASVGLELTPDGYIPREVFIEGAKPGSDMAFVLHDAAVLISLALQHGVSPEVLAHSLARIPLNPDDESEITPASATGAAVDFLLRIEAEAR